MTGSARSFTTVRSQVVTTGGCWLLLALFIGESRLLENAPRLVVQLVLLALTGSLLAFYCKAAAFRRWVNELDLRWLVGLHVIRFVGFYFLFLHKRGDLPHHFAVPAGCGDIVVAAAACAILLLPPEGSFTRRTIVAWNAIGLLDILFVVAMAAWLGLNEPASMRPLTHLPLSLLPTFVVPLIIASHVVVFARLWPGRTPASHVAMDPALRAAAKREDSSAISETYPSA